MDVRNERFGGREEPMRSKRALTRLGMLIVGLGIGGVVAATPGIASADSSSD
jgi:hypothetical protein